MSTEPVLPEPQRLHGSFRDWYTADQMRAMFKAGREQGLEEAAKVCEEVVVDWVDASNRPTAEPLLREAAANIRSIGKATP